MKTAFKAAPFILSAVMMAACAGGSQSSALKAEAAPAPVDATDYSQPVDRAILSLGNSGDGGFTIQDMSFKDQPITLGTCKALAEDAAHAGYSRYTQASITCLNQGQRAGNFIGLHR